MKPLTFLELKAMVPALASTTPDGAQGAIASHIKHNRLVRNEDGTFDASHLDKLWALDPDNQPKSDEAKASLLGKRIEAIDAELETLQHKIIPLAAERELLRARRKDFIHLGKAELASDHETLSEKHDRERAEAVSPAKPKHK